MSTAGWLTIAILALTFAVREWTWHRRLRKAEQERARIAGAWEESVERQRRDDYWEREAAKMKRVFGARDQALRTIQRGTHWERSDGNLPPDHPLAHVVVAWTENDPSSVLYRAASDLRTDRASLSRMSPSNLVECYRLVYAPPTSHVR